MKTFFNRCAIPLYLLLSRNQIKIQRHSTTEIVSNLNIDHDRVLSFHSLKKSRRILEYFSLHYLHYHNMEPIDIMRYIDHYMFIESLVYLVDDENEAANKTLKYDFWCTDILSDQEFDYNVHHNQAFSMMYRHLKQNNFYDEYTHKQLYNGMLYYKIEQYISNALEKSNSGEKKISKYLVDKCNSLRSYDFRLLNLMTYKLTKQPYNDDIIKFLFCVELNFEILEDLSSYEKDVLKNTFNIYRMYVNLYKDDAALHFEKYCHTLKEQFSNALDNLLVKYPTLSKVIHHQIDSLDLAWKKITPNEPGPVRQLNVPKPILNEHN